MPAEEEPTAELPPPAKVVPESTENIDQLRKQAVEMQKQLELLLRKIEELENKKAADPTG